MSQPQRNKAPAPVSDFRFEIEIMRIYRVFDEYQVPMTVTLHKDIDYVQLHADDLEYLLDKDDYKLFLNEEELDTLKIIGNYIIETALTKIRGNPTHATQFNYVNKGSERLFNFNLYGMQIAMVNQGKGHYWQQYELDIKKL